MVNEETTSFVARNSDGLAVIVKESPIERVEVMISDSLQPKYLIQVISRLPLGSNCSEFKGHVITRPTPNTFEVTLTHMELAEPTVICKKDSPSVQTDIPLNWGAILKSGQVYTVVVNESVTETFTAR